jgi:hypothetical protein
MNIIRNQIHVLVNSNFADEIVNACQLRFNFFLSKNRCLGERLR